MKTGFRIATMLIVCWFAGAPLVAQTLRLSPSTLRISAPKDGAIVHSGKPLDVTVDADPSLLESVTLNVSCSHVPAPDLAVPPYRFRIQIPPEASSGSCAIEALGTLRSGNDLALDGVFVGVERPDLPQELKPEFSVWDLSVGEATHESFLGIFPDGSKVVVSDSRYLAYRSDRPGIVSVDSLGWIKAVAPGTAKITITYGNDSIGRISVKVLVNVFPRKNQPR